MISDSLIATLRSALEQNPHDAGIRLHLAELLLQRGDIADAGAEYERLLSEDPANIAALQGAADSAARLGQDAKAAGYRKLLAALGGDVAKPVSASAEVTPLHNPAPSDAAARPKPESEPPPNTSSAPAAEQADPADKVTRLHAVGTDDNVTVGPWEDTQARITLDDVGGMEHVKKRLHMSFLAPLQNPEVRKLFSKSLRGGMLLYGPPGCGKTFIARALAGELGATFMSVGLSDVLDMWLGESERKLHELFETARRKAPAVLFFDEVDALGQKRSQQRNSAGRNIVNQLLAEMDSVGSDNRNVFILAATNHPWDVDTALRRPGRFDRITLVLPPDLEARRQILAYHLRERPVADIDLAPIAARTEYYSGADLAHVCESAVEYAMHDSIESGTVRGVTMDDLLRACAETQPSTRAWFETARNYAMFANEGGVYDDLLDYLRTHKL